MVDEGQGAPPHAVLLAVVVGAVVAGPYMLGDGREAVAAAIADIFSPTGLLILTVALILLIHFLSSDKGSAFSAIFTAAASPDSIHRAGGSPAGVAIVVLLLVVLLYFRVSLFGGGDDE